MTPSQQHYDIAAALSQPGHIIVNAVAGSGKTTTGVWLAQNYIPRHYRSKYLAFGRENANELETRLPYWVTADTFHRTCKRALESYLPKRPRVEDGKVKFILKDLVPEWKDRKLIQSDLLKLISFAKANGTLVIPGAPTLEELNEHLDLDVDCRLAARVLQRNNEDLKLIDYDDMLYLALARNAPLETVDLLFIDEAQDTNPVQLALAERMLNPNGRLIAVGDTRQAIYAFRGADSNAMRKIKERFNCREFPLSVCHRCASSVVNEARKYILNPKEQPARARLTRFDLMDPDGRQDEFDAYN